MRGLPGQALIASAVARSWPSCRTPCDNSERTVVATMTRADIVAFATRDWRFIEDEKRRFWVRRKRDLTSAEAQIAIFVSMAS